jgi:hypothetical protein
VRFTIIAVMHEVSGNRQAEQHRFASMVVPAFEKLLIGSITIACGLNASNHR